MNEAPGKLLPADDPAPVAVHNKNGRSPFLIVADHAGNFVLPVVGNLRARGRAAGVSTFTVAGLEGGQF
jgi:hypothetical protein